MTHQELPSYDQAPAGAIRFNTDSRKLEVYTGGPVGYGTLPNGQWMQVDSFTPDIATGGSRGLHAGGQTPTATLAIDYFNISSTGNAISFGNLTGSARFGIGTGASRTRGVFFGGATPTRLSVIDYVEISSTGSAASFGSLTGGRAGSGTSNSTRGLAIAGAPGLSSIEYVTIASTGNSVFFGDLAATDSGGSAFASSTRAVYGRSGGTNAIGIEFITISTLGNAADFGDKTVSRSSLRGSSNSVRGLWGGGYAPAPTSANTNVIDYVTIANLGNAVDFGDLIEANTNAQSCASPIRAVWAGGTTPSVTNRIQYVQIMSTGNAVDFGDLNNTVTNGGALSNGHGGL